MKSESYSDPCSKHGRGRVQLGRCRVGRVGTMAVHAQVQLHKLLANSSCTNSIIDSPIDPGVCTTDAPPLR